LNNLSVFKRRHQYRFPVPADPAGYRLCGDGRRSTGYPGTGGWTGQGACYDSDTVFVL